jgi:WD40 repeat protein
MSAISKAKTDERWYYARGKQKLGPFSFTQLAGLALGGQIQPDSMVLSEGMKKWIKASEVPCLFPNSPPVATSHELGVPLATLVSGTGLQSTLPRIHHSSSRLRRPLLVVAIIATVIALGGYTLMKIFVTPSHSNPVYENNVISLAAHSESIWCTAFSPDGRFGLTGSHEKPIRLWNLATGKEIHCFNGHTRGVSRIAFAPDGRFFVSAAHDNTLRLWDGQAGKELRRFEGRTDLLALHSLVFSPDGRRLYAGSDDGVIRQWEVETGKSLYCFQVGEASKRYVDRHVEGVALSPNGRQVVAGGSDNTVRVLDIHNGKQIWCFRGHTAEVHAVAFSPNGRYVVSASGGPERDNEQHTVMRNGEAVYIDCTLRLLDAETGRELRRVDGHTQEVQCVAVSADSRLVVSGSHDGTVRVWDAETGKPQRIFAGPKHVSSVAFSPDSRWVLRDCSKRPFSVNQGYGKETIPHRSHG